MTRLAWHARLLTGGSLLLMLGAGCDEDPAPGNPPPIDAAVGGDAHAEAAEAGRDSAPAPDAMDAGSADAPTSDDASGDTALDGNGADVADGRGAPVDGAADAIEDGPPSSDGGLRVLVDPNPCWKSYADRNGLIELGQ